MKKFIASFIAIVIVLSMAAPVLAVTPPLDVPDIPEIPDIGDDIHIDIPDEVFDSWFEEHPVPPLMPSDEYSWFNWLRAWFWWMPKEGNT